VVHFVVRRAGPRRAAILLSVPFATWQAYNRAGQPGESIYWTEDPRRAGSVTFDRPGGGPPPERWEHGMMRWLRGAPGKQAGAGLDPGSGSRSGTSAGAAFEVDYCSNLDLHLDPALIAPYRLLLIVGHDEYWTWEMRDTVEGFVRHGGNLAVFGANTAWWQMRLADGGRTMICYRDAVADPIAAEGHPELSTVEWSSAPVGRPENSMTGLSFRLGAGCWGPKISVMFQEAYTVRFADHWVFDGTGLRDGDRFAQGAIGYETDAADISESSGAPRVTGRDGTPGSFVVLATADLRHWAEYGQGGHATLGVFTSGLGSVFNAGTVNWGAALHDPVVDRITRNVVTRFAGPLPPSVIGSATCAGHGSVTGAGPSAGTAVGRSDPFWIAVGTRDPIRALAAVGATLYAVLAGGPPMLASREACPQNLSWHRLGAAEGVVGLAAPRDAVDGAPGGVYGFCEDGTVLLRPGSQSPAGWAGFGRGPARGRGFAVADNHFFVLDDAGVLWSAPQGRITNADWSVVETPGGGIPRLLALAAVNGRLVAIDDRDQLLSRLPLPGARWDVLGAGGGCAVLTGHAGTLYGSAPGLPLRAAVPTAWCQRRGAR
jgi:hypothetical protein